MGNIGINCDKKQIENLKKSLILQNKFLKELYTKIQHVQGVVREMVEVDEKLKFELQYLQQKTEEKCRKNENFQNEIKHFLKKQLIEKDEQINILSKEIKKLRSIFECGLSENHKAFQNKYDSMHGEYMEHYKKTAKKTENIQKIWNETNEKYQNLKANQIEFVHALLDKTGCRQTQVTAENVHSQQLQ